MSCKKSECTVQVSSTTGNRSRPGTMLLTNHHVNSSRAATMNAVIITNQANKVRLIDISLTKFHIS